MITPTAILSGATYVGFSIATADEELAWLVTAIVCALVLCWRLWRWDGEARPVHVTERKRYVDQPEPRPQIEPAMVSETNGQWRLSPMFTFRESEWRRFARAVADGKVTRRKLDEVVADDGEKLFTNTTENYNDYVREFQRIGWLDGDKNVQDAAWQWLRERGISPPPA